MKIIVHRGANQIGGCITEIATNNCKILIDFGSNLPGKQQNELTKEQVEMLTMDVDSVFYTHYHSDHVGLFQLLPFHIPQYIGEGAKDVMLCKFEQLGGEEEIEAIKRMKVYNAAERIDVANKGMIFVTPYFVSHSAFDAYMFKIECEGKIILHTGDFRKHGYLGKGLFPTLERLVGPVDILITEGTMLGREKERIIHENTIKRNVSKLLSEHKYVFALCSSTDIDRLASFYNACKQTGRVFLVDKYQRQILEIFSKYAGKESTMFQFTDAFKLINYKTENVRYKLQQQGFLMPVRTSHRDLVKSMLDIYSDEPAWLIYSMWSGYAEKRKEYCIKKVLDIRSLFGCRIKDGVKDGFHTSGHVSAETILQVCSVVKPKIGIIPIHIEEVESLEDLFRTSPYRLFRRGESQIENIQIILN